MWKMCHRVTHMSNKEQRVLQINLGHETTFLLCHDLWSMARCARVSGDPVINVLQATTELGLDYEEHRDQHNEGNDALIYGLNKHTQEAHQPEKNKNKCGAYKVLGEHKRDRLPKLFSQRRLRKNKINKDPAEEPNDDSD
jgi:hypothetical protein